MNNKLAKWIKDPFPGLTPGGDPYYICTNCNYGRCYGVEHPKPLPKICPNCKAVMENGENNETK